MKNYKVTFKTERNIYVEADDEVEAEEKAESLFDGFCDWEIEVNEE